MSEKVVAVTGAASGIGLSLAKLLATRGAKISMSDVSMSALEKARSTILESSPSVKTEDILLTTCDVREPDQIRSWLKETVEKFGRLDGAANVAGVISKYHGQEEGLLKNQDEREWDFVLGVNLTGAMHCMKEELAVIQQGGSIVNASSISGLRGFPGNAVYSASKAGLIALTRVAACEHGTNSSKHVRVNAVARGLIETPMLATVSEGHEDLDAEVKRVPIARKAEAVEVAKVMAFLLSDDASFITGSTYMVDGGWFSV